MNTSLVNTLENSSLDVIIYPKKLNSETRFDRDLESNENKTKSRVVELIRQVIDKKLRNAFALLIK